MESYRKMEVSTTPCEGCVHNERCATEQQACLAFALYVDKGEDNWEIPRLPSTKTYSRIMNAFDASLKFEIKQAKEKCYG